MNHQVFFLSVSFLLFALVFGTVTCDCWVEAHNLILILLWWRRSIAWTDLSQEITNCINLNHQMKFQLQAWCCLRIGAVRHATRSCDCLSLFSECGRHCWSECSLIAKSTRSFTGWQPVMMNSDKRWWPLSMAGKPIVLRNFFGVFTSSSCRMKTRWRTWSTRTRCCPKFYSILVPEIEQRLTIDCDELGPWRRNALRTLHVVWNFNLKILQGLPFGVSLEWQEPPLYRWSEK